MENMEWLADWFGAVCDGEWESEYGVTIETVNNPGWMVRIDLDGTGLNPAAFEPIADQRTATDWVECKVEEGAWLGGGGVGNLDEVVGIFRAWVEGGGSPRRDRPVRDNRRPGGPPHRGGGGGKRFRGPRR